MSNNVADHQMIAHEDWIAEHKALLAKENGFSRLRDELNARRRESPVGARNE